MLRPTIATNAWLTRTGARVCLVVTAGFRDVLEIARQTRPELYDYRVYRPRPLVAKKAKKVSVAELIGDLYAGKLKTQSIGEHS